MIQISRAADYAIRGVLYLTMKPRYKFVLLDEISERQNIPRSFLTKIFMSLSKSGIVDSRRGYKGGFMLAKSPDDITILDIIESIEGTVSINQCVNFSGTCDRENFCPVREVWKKTQKEIFNILKGTSMQSLSDRSGEIRLD